MASGDRIRQPVSTAFVGLAGLIVVVHVVRILAGMSELHRVFDSKTVNSGCCFQAWVGLTMTPLLSLSNRQRNSGVTMETVTEIAGILKCLKESSYDTTSDPIALHDHCSAQYELP